MWQVSEMWVGANDETYIWVSFPVSNEDNRVAALMLHPEVGMAVAARSAPPSETALKRIAEAHKAHPEHPAIAQLKVLGIASRLKLSGSGGSTKPEKAPRKRKK